MNLNDEVKLSYYKQIAAINEKHGIFLVQYTETGNFYVKKVLDFYDASVYATLKAHHIKNTPQIFETVEDDGKMIVIEEYIKGELLSDILDKEKTLDEKQATDIIRSICLILNDLHNLVPPVIHRDIKPSNVIISSDGIVKLLDMDAAKNFKEDSSRDTNLMGTAGYAAPEQYGFGASDVRTDIYALGVLLNVMLTGKYPQDAVADGAISAYMRKMFNKKGLKQQDIFLAADISERYGYKLISEEKHTVQRDTILRLCIAARFSLTEVQRALRLYGMSPQLFLIYPT